LSFFFALCDSARLQTSACLLCDPAFYFFALGSIVRFLCFFMLFLFLMITFGLVFSCRCVGDFCFVFVFFWLPLVLFCILPAQSIFSLPSFSPFPSLFASVHVPLCVCRLVFVFTPVGWLYSRCHVFCLSLPPPFFRSWLPKGCSFSLVLLSFLCSSVHFPGGVPHWNLLI